MVWVYPYPYSFRCITSGMFSWLPTPLVFPPFKRGLFVCDDGRPSQQQTHQSFPLNPLRWVRGEAWMPEIQFRDKKGMFSDGRIHVQLKEFGMDGKPDKIMWDAIYDPRVGITLGTGIKEPGNWNFSFYYPIGYEDVDFFIIIFHHFYYFNFFLFIDLQVFVSYSFSFDAVIHLHRGKDVDLRVPIINFLSHTLCHWHNYWKDTSQKKMS